MVSRDRGQAHTLEAIMAAALLLGSLVFALQVTAVTPLSASTSSQHIENQEAATAAGVLATAVADGSLERNLLACSPSGDGPTFVGTTRREYYVSAPLASGNYTAFGEKLHQAFGSRSIAYNVYLSYDGADGREEFVYQGSPSDNAVTATRTVVLRDGDRRTEWNTGEDRLVATGDELGTGSSCFGSPNADTTVHKVIEVTIVVWRQ